MHNLISVEKVAIIASGYIENYDEIRKVIQSYDLFIAVDGGLNHCVYLGITPTWLIGDMDSLDQSLCDKFPMMQKLVFPKDKDYTDTELALNFLIKKAPKSITLFAAFGHRIDHSLGNIFLLSRFPDKVFLETEREILCVIKKSLELNTIPGQIISLIPLNGPVEGIFTEGLKWELSNKRLDKDFLGISNQAIAYKIRITANSGDLLVTIQK